MKVTVTTPLSCTAYLSALKQNLDNALSFSERFTGFAIGKVFAITHHSGFTSNRRVTDVKNTALGFLREADDSCEIRFIRLKGFLGPIQFLTLLLIMLAVNLIIPLTSEVSGDLFPFFPLLGIGSTVIVAPVEAFAECLSEESWDGEKALLSLMMDPQNPWGNYDKV